MRETKLTPLPTRPKIHYLEGVRGYAALTVMVYHLSHELLTPLLQDNRLLMLLTSNGPLGLLCEKKHSPNTPYYSRVDLFPPQWPRDLQLYPEAADTAQCV